MSIRTFQITYHVDCLFRSLVSLRSKKLPKLHTAGSLWGGVGSNGCQWIPHTKGQQCRWCFHAMMSSWCGLIITDFPQDSQQTPKAGLSKWGMWVGLLHFVRWKLDLPALVAILKLYALYCITGLCYNGIYRKISNISHTKSQNSNVSHLILQLSLPNSLKPGVKSRMKTRLEQCPQVMLQLHLSDQQVYCLLSLILY